MTYRELLKLYKEGKLEESKTQEIENDIERQEAISEYLFESEELFPEESIVDSEPVAASDNATSPTEEQFIKHIRKTIRFTFLKIGAVIGAVVLAIVLCVIFLLPDFVSSLYYNPTEEIYTTEETKYTDGTVGLETYSTNRMSLDMAVYSELFLPGHYRDSVTAIEHGYGEYSICIKQCYSYTGSFTDVAGMLRQNELLLFDANALKLPVDNCFLETEETKALNFSFLEVDIDGVRELIGPVGTKEDAINKLYKLDDRDYYIGYITLSHLATYEDFIRWFEEKNLNHGSLWCSVYVEDKSGSYTLLQNTGFVPYGVMGELCYDAETYPNLCLADATREELRSGDYMQTHFISMLKYMRDNKTFYEMMSHQNEIKFDEAIAAIEHDGLQIHGFAVVAKRDELLKFVEDENVYYIYANEYN